MCACSSTADHARPSRALLGIGIILALLVAGCARETPETREVRRSAQEYLKALAQRDLKELQARSTCLASTNSFVRGKVLAIDSSLFVPFRTIDSLARATMTSQRSSDSAWSHADESHADSLYTRARTIARFGASLRCAVRAAYASLPGTPMGTSVLETRRVRVRVRYAGPVVGPSPVDTAEYLRLLRAPGGKWIVFSKYRVEDDPWPDRI